MKSFKEMFQKLGGRKSSFPAGKEGCRLYAVGDIHGRLDLLEDLLARIERDSASQPPARTFVVFLGDLIDRGPQSAGVVERLRTYAPPNDGRAIFLSGNHEEVFMRILAGDTRLLSDWLKFGGSECAESYGIDSEKLGGIDAAAAVELIRSKVPRSHREFLKSFGDTFRFGDYLFVHAGIRPGVGLESQDRTDLRWIRDPFLSDNSEHGFVVVHGHTIVSSVEERPNRVGIDTGAYRTGILTAIIIDHDKRRFISTGG